MKLQLIAAAIASTVLAFGAFAQNASDSDKAGSDDASSQISRPSEVPASTESNPSDAARGDSSSQGRDSQPSNSDGAPVAGQSAD